MPKLSLRDLFWFVTLCAVLVAWLVDHHALYGDNRRIASDLSLLVGEIQKTGQYVVKWDDDYGKGLRVEKRQKP
jgi:hypothetical protein